MSDDALERAFGAFPDLAEPDISADGLDVFSPDPVRCGCDESIELRAGSEEWKALADQHEAEIAGLKAEVGRMRAELDGRRECSTCGYDKATHLITGDCSICTCGQFR